MADSEQLLKLAQQYGTPLYVYDGDGVVQHYRALFDFIPWPRLRVHYALKANYNPMLLKLLGEAGASIDAVSPGEVHLALQLGFPKERILFTANNLTDAEFDEVRDLGVLMNIGSLSRLAKAADRAPGMAVCLRFNPDVMDGDNEKTMTGGDLTKFGILLEDIGRVLEIVRRGNLRVVGLHEHTGSGLQHTESVFRSMKQLMSVATPENFPELEFLDFGGGFKVPYKPGEERVDYYAMGREIVSLFGDFCRRYGRELEMRFEPGKYMVAESGWMLTEVNTIKHNRSRVIAGCNAGFPQLIRPVLYGAYHQIENLSHPAGELHCYDVCGNICETGDRFAEQRELPELREGDILAIGNAGAYCYSMGGIYNLRPMPSEVVIVNGTARLVRRAPSHRELAQSVLGEYQL
ncbi:MAG: diaminopimelate decarboxylase [Lentisphaeria bacterium]|nr:diaminopimelate decarboxylase [Lentisphaeria bacterium]